MKKPTLQYWLGLSALGASFLISVPPARAATEVLNSAPLRKALGLDAFKPDDKAIARLEHLKIAVLDNGFSGFIADHGQLPASAELIAGPQNPELPTTHGLGMAEIVWAMVGRPAAGPHFYLVNANGFTNFRAAIDFVIREHVDIVLYSQVWTFGGDLDGKGFINGEVTRALDAGTLWINAAGNFGGLTRTGEIAGRISPDTRLLTFAETDGKGGGDRGDLRFENHLDENSATITLSWSDFADDPVTPTREDLDLLIYDSKDRLVGSSELIQRGEAPPAGDPTSRLSSYPREVVRLTGLDRGQYHIRIRAQSSDFRATDRFKIVLENDKPGSLDFTDHSAGGEILPPADHPGVITVGESFPGSSTGPTSDGRIKPDVLIENSTIAFSNGNTVRGSSTAAAMLAGTIAAMKSARPELTTGRLREYIESLKTSAGATSDLRPADPAAWPPLPDQVTALVPSGGRLMISPTGHFVILTPVDALALPAFQAVQAFRNHADDVMCIDSESLTYWRALPPEQAAIIEQPWVEFRGVSAAPGIWRTPSPAELQNW